MALGCCSRFKKCSDTGRCLFEMGYEVPGDLDYPNCLYKENIDKGKNFYTEYNENNKRRKEEYEAELLRLKEQKNKPIAKKEKEEKINKKQYTETYIQVSNRIFLVGERGYGGWSRSLKREDKEYFISILEEKNIDYHNKAIEGLAEDDTGSEEDRCNWRVILNLGDKKYNIQNYNVRGIRKSTAIKVASYFINRGLDAELEVLEGFSGSKIIKSMTSTKTVNKLSKEIKQNKEQKVSIEQIEQLSMFDNQVSIEKMQYVN